MFFMRLCLLLLCLYSATLVAAPRVVTSIAPLQEITATLMGDIAKPELIIDSQASMHHFAFKPSHMQLLQRANLVIWIDRHFEAGFSRVPEILSPGTEQLELLPRLGLAQGDGHIWYSPRLLLRSTELISDSLLQLDPANRASYQANAARLMQEIRAWWHEIRRRWQKRQPRFVTDHNFSEYFEQDLDIRASGTVHNQHHDHGGLRNLEQLDDQLRQSPAACLLTLHDTASPLARSFARKYDLKIVSIALQPVSDPTKPLILQRLARLTTALEQCM